MRYLPRVLSVSPKFYMLWPIFAKSPLLRRASTDLADGICELLVEDRVFEWGGTEDCGCRTTLHGLAGIMKLSETIVLKVIAAYSNVEYRRADHILRAITKDN